MKLLSIDPGITTGYALLNGDGSIAQTGNLEPDDLSESVLISYSQDVEIQVVIEQLPPTPDRELARVVGFLDQLFPTATKIGPGIWKSNRSIINLSIPHEFDGREFTPHQKDAYKLGMYHLIFNLYHPMRTNDANN